MAIWNKINFRAKFITRNKKRQFHNDKGVNSSRGHYKPNVYTSNNRASEYMI